MNHDDKAMAGQKDFDISQEAIAIQEKLQQIEQERSRLGLMQMEMQRAEVLLDQLRGEYKGSREKLEVLANDLRQQIAQYTNEV